MSDESWREVWSGGIKPKQEPQKEILVTDVLVIQRVQRPYPLSDVEVVAELEKHKSIDEILNDIATELPYIASDKIIHTRVVTVRNKNESGESE